MRRNTYVFTSHAHISRYGDSHNRWKVCFSISNKEDTNPYPTFVANTNKKRFVPYTLRVLHSLQAENDKNDKLPTNTVTIDIGSQCQTTFVGFESIQYMERVFTKNRDVSDLSVSDTTGQFVTKNTLLGLVVKAAFLPKTLWSYTTSSS